MPRRARIVIAGCPHHITQRGNNRQDVFFVDADRQRYLDILKEQAARFGLAIDAYCLMTNHVHLVARPSNEQSLAKAIGRTNLYYTRYVNHLHGRSGHLWQDRFFSCPLDEEYFWNAIIYAERNAVRARLVRRAWRYPWSSAAAHVDGQDQAGLLDLRAWAKRRITGRAWQEVLSRPADEQVTQRLRTWSYRGCPLGSDNFISKIETRLGLRLRPGVGGRPRKKGIIGNRPK